MCETIFLPNVKVNKEYYKKYYRLDYYDQSGVNKNSVLEKILAYISKLSNLKKESLIYNTFNSNKKMSILDVGCGRGNFLSALNPLRFKKYGVEINREAYEVSRKKGLNVFYGDITKVNFGSKKFDAVSLWHVLEHLDKPNTLFMIINKILIRKGVLIFQVPNPKSLGFKFGREYWFHLDSPRHLTLCGVRAIKQLCKQNNFKLVSIVNEFYDYPLDLFWSIRKSPIRFLFYPLYPVVKFLDRETLTFVCIKKEM
ncbi:hypothetical protein A3G67_03110 [Candidatus Roizmanbacteria bacterium RIFCSPLOWO2_12_FULL_40_12]|uniref:Methyltransferase domain-containing protein n=1 Tax=Candidatus Roizmanbacteria bacterium RIFCSPLOWO2_01_FULL_40_42 TaxID=1802066 RepID=A0A1F7J5E4_9BACT|nr:MAG: hypothetical protein A2779_02745 [Candidatus Roizmanbacteria bacterium RIFCSPHIGHO2_01_FULL_40_98]OGK28261.1 MAG: hypothetical protein A3C31_00110 [Candidatus Roizmanbacteria bacterium RIFCSPHIGHO2_02_FULL_40_53]OGK30497.1 MAG: hypothetical protein A2W49_02795 [Candidatus Roizmanbacteria bacterium RIFCSPHIGHO2_12_41_18]OGK36911.1 MAG: hypothetical protein A3E69_00370 [Candidatus Roizmanbacteria bacterium RIFCSPHIGHO2_12_FULL_40_130]OGK50817.1 MAG: hypothetical protein A3B50_00880 [Candi